MPPWVAEHPDVFDDPNFSITALQSTRAEDSMMEISHGSPLPLPLQPLHAGEERRERGSGGGGGAGYAPKEVLFEEEPMSVSGKEEVPIGELMPTLPPPVEDYTCMVAFCGTHRSCSGS